MTTGPSLDPDSTIPPLWHDLWDLWGIHLPKECPGYTLAAGSASCLVYLLPTLLWKLSESRWSCSCQPLTNKQVTPGGSEGRALVHQSPNDGNITQNYTKLQPCTATSTAWVISACVTSCCPCYHSL
jgi:hypothetical protein